MLDQNEIHPYYQDKAVIEYLHDNGIVVEAWYPLGGRGFNSELMKEPVIMDIARKHGKSLVLTPEEMGRIDALERREKHDWY